MKTEEYKQFREIIRTLEKKIGVLNDSELSCCGITLAQCHALVEIGRAESISLNELAGQMSLDNSTMSRTVNNLVNSGMAIRVAESAGQKIYQDQAYRKRTIAFQQDRRRHEQLFSRNIYPHPRGKKRTSVGKPGSCC